MVAIRYKGTGKQNLANPKYTKRDIVNGDILDVPKEVADDLKNDPRWSILKEKKDVNKKQKETKEMI